MATVIVAKRLSRRADSEARGHTEGTIRRNPSTLGLGYDTVPSEKTFGDLCRERSGYHYQPKLFAEVPDTQPEALLPPGPNSPVGRVWMSLSRRHYGIHGTASPETIGYAQSHGCVRLTNWDAIQLSDMVEPGTPVEFH